MFTRAIMDFAKILIITITGKQLLYAKNNIFDADRSEVSLKGKSCSIWLLAYKTEVVIYTGSTTAQNKIPWCFPKAIFTLLHVWCKTDIDWNN